MTNKIKIIDNERTIEGEMKTALAKSFGSSAHIVIPKEHIGKYIEVVISDNGDYGWLLSEPLREKIVKVCEKIIKSKKDDKGKQYQLNDIQNLLKSKFKIVTLLRAIDLLKTEHEDSPDRIYVDVIEKAYGLNKGFSQGRIKVKSGIR